jgi:type IV secretory pathway TraG/TraD family ATPase VirD4
MKNFYDDINEIHYQMRSMMRKTSDCKQFIEDSQGNNCVPEKLLLKKNRDSGIIFGLENSSSTDTYVGMPQGHDGNTAGIGGNGSGKSYGCAKPTLESWQGALCATDIKGELSDYYSELYNEGIVKRPFIVFNPMQVGGIGYDPFWWIHEDGEKNLVTNVMEMVIAMNPLKTGDNQPFWVETEQGILVAALLYYFKLGNSFGETMDNILSSTVSELVNIIVEKGGSEEKMYLGELTKMKLETIANFDRGLRNKLMLFATDPYISNAFRGSRDDVECFNWGQLNDFNIFLNIPMDKIEQWSPAVILMLTQLIRHLERRPEKYSPEGAKNIQTLLLLDEIARFGKLEMLPGAMSTLRSKCVNVCLLIQSIAQLDKFYGEHDRRIILDNCQFICIFRANDAETQKYLSDLIGTVKIPQKSHTYNYSLKKGLVGYGVQGSEGREPRVFPHELANLKDVLLLHPEGFCRIAKITPYKENPIREVLLDDEYDEFFEE